MSKQESTQTKEALPSPCRLSEAKRVDKLWGGEIWLSEDGGAEAGYCGKILVLQKGTKGSLHYHPVKDETMLVLEGKLGIEVCACGECETTVGFEMFPGNFIRLRAGIPHRFQALTPVTVLVEISTPHNNDDVVRIEESQRIIEKENPDDLPSNSINLSPSEVREEVRE